MSSYKIIQSGHIIEIYKYQRGVGGNHDDISKKGASSEQVESDEPRDRTEDIKALTNQRARNKIRRLVNANFDENSTFVTLTFAEHITDIAFANKEFQLFIKKMKRTHQKDFKHVTVIEFTKAGRIHYHMLCNFRVEWKNNKELQAHERALAEVWGNGFVDIGYKKSDNVGAYLIKYMTKENGDSRLCNKKRYFFLVT